MENPAVEFANRIDDTQSGRDEVNDFVRRVAPGLLSADVLVPAPMAVAILGQLTLVATATDFKMTQPPDGFHHIRYPDSFRATIMQLVNTGALSLNRSFVNFDEISKRCAAVKPGVNNIIQLLIGDESSTARENELDIERHLPAQIQSLSGTIQACLEKAQETDEVFNKLLELTMEIHESCTATQGENEMRIHQAKARLTFLDEQKQTKEQLKRMSEQATARAQEAYENDQMRYDKATKSMPGAWTIAGLQFSDCITNTLGGLATILTLGAARRPRSAASSPNAASGADNPPPYSSAGDVADPGYDQAATLRKLADALDVSLTAGEGRRPDWNLIKSREHYGGCLSIHVGLEQVVHDLRKYNPHSGAATESAKGLAKRGMKYAHRLGEMIPPGRPNELEEIIDKVSKWHDDVLTFASQADMRRRTSLMNPSTFVTMPQPDYSGGSSAELAVRSAQYKLALTSAQLNASRENSKAETEKLMEVTTNLGEVLAQIAEVNVQKINWEEIVPILGRAIGFLCQLKAYLNNLVHFFNSINNLVSVSLKSAADGFIRTIKDATAIDNGEQKTERRGPSLSAFSRQAIYRYAIEAAKISRLVENYSDMYVTLYHSNIHPGVNMLLGMGALVGSDDRQAIADAGVNIQQWAAKASDGITALVVERLRINEQDIQARIRELEQSLGGILPPAPELQQIVNKAEAELVKETVEDITTAAAANPVYKKSSKSKMFV